MVATIDLYDQDFYAWTRKNAELLRQGRLDEIDVENIAEELETMGRSEQRELESRLKVLLQHLLKWQHQPEARSSSWSGTIDEQRYQLGALLRQSPSLRPRVQECLDFAYPAARRAASRETGLPLAVFPQVCPFTNEQALDEAFWPNPG